MKIAVVGPSGRMGRLVADRVAAADDLELSGLLDREQCELRELHGVSVSADPKQAFAGADAYIDFSVPQASEAAALSAPDNIAAVIGTTGLTTAAHQALDALDARCPVLIASNFSLGVNLLAALVETAARALGPDYDAEIVELHHSRKRDAPSGTALTLAEAVASGRKQSLSDVACFARHGDIGPRPSGEIGLQTVRGGDIIGEHTVYLIGETERLELTHRAQDRRLFADGAIAAARYLVGKTPGRYAMRNVLGLAG